MAYIGRGLDKISNIEKLDAITFDGSQSYSLTKSSVAFTPNSANSLIISINGVCQFGNVTVSGTSVDFGVAMPSTDTNDFILHLGVGVVNTPADDTVSTAKIQDDAVTSDKLGTGDMTFPNGDLIFGTAGKGVCLGVTSNTDANTLDEYEEGVWTPAVSGGNQVVTSITTAKYIRIGKLVHVDCYVALDDVTDGTALAIGGLPFNATNYDSTCIVNVSQSSESRGILGRTYPSSAVIYFYYTDGNQTAVVQTAPHGHFIFSLHYYTSA